ncbi:MAG: S-methyl-5-thioribose-1-phosphate isomerase [Wenzhouxiangellaceae bacterium]|nr:S-methyl-5-thioribose-1-phosphate isomerase [Wenzhouxiangellaceae bacterium]
MIWLHRDDPGAVQTIDQRELPHRLVVVDLRTCEDGARAISEMWVRGAPLIGATAAWSLYLAALQADRDRLTGSDRRLFLEHAADALEATRPTAVNLHWALARMRALFEHDDDVPAAGLAAEAARICDEDVEISRRIGKHGLELIEAIVERNGGRPVNILTHCNAGALATINWGTATAPIYLAHQRGIPVHVWVDETRPRNQGSQLTAWELAQSGIPHTVIVDNAGGHLMQHGRVDLCITGTDRTTRHGDVANKIGTYLKALAAHDNNIPFYVALPSTTIDWNIRDGRAEITIEERPRREVTHIPGMDGDTRREVRTVNDDSTVANPAFDVTPARLVTGLITERGICAASETGLTGLFPEHASNAA